MTLASHRIFLSHSSKDHDFCVRLVDDLRRILGDEDAVWYDARGGLHGGDAWWQKIERELNTRTTFLVVLSPDAVTSAWVNDEIDIAWRRKNDPDPAKKMSVLPVLYRSCPIRPSLENIQIVSFLHPKSYEAAFQEILIALGLPPKLTNEQHVPSAIPPQSPSAPDSEVQKLLTPASPATVAGSNIEFLRVLSGHTNYVESVSLSSDGQLLASGGYDKTIRLWNPRTGQLRRIINGHTDTVRSVALSTDGQVLASASKDKTIQLWNPQTGQSLHKLSTLSEYLVMALSANGIMLAYTAPTREQAWDAKYSIELWDVRKWKHLRSIKNLASGPTSLALSADGQRLASGHYNGEIRLWNSQTGKLLHTLSGHAKQVKSIATSLDGRILASGGEDDIIQIWNVQTGDLLSTLIGGSVKSVALNADGLWLASGGDDNIARLWNTQTGERLRTFRGRHATYEMLYKHPYYGPESYVSSVALSSDGLIFAYGSWDKMVGICGVKE